MKIYLKILGELVRVLWEMKLCFLGVHRWKHVTQGYRICHCCELRVRMDHDGSWTENM